MKIYLSRMAVIALVTASAWATGALAHCDTLDGPVISMARKALETGDIKPALVWIRSTDEGEVRRAFQKAFNVRKSGGQARELADTYFFETLVRVHRVGEGASYTGLKPAGTTEVPVAAVDQALASGRLEALAKAITDRNEKGLHQHFEQVMAKKNYDPNDVDAGRAYANAYVEFVHYAERLYDAAETMAPDAASTSVSSHAH